MTPLTPEERAAMNDVDIASRLLDYLLRAKWIRGVRADHLCSALRMIVEEIESAPADLFMKDP